MVTTPLASRIKARGAVIGASLERWRLPLRVVFIAGMAGFIGWQLWRIGPQALVAQVPVNPLFYLIYWVGFAVLPISEMLIFRTIWPAAPRAPFWTLVRKRVLNNLVLGYSGDVWFALWARRRLGLPDRRLIAGLKDSSLLSGAASAVITAGIALVFVLSGQGDLLARAIGERPTGTWADLLVAAVALGVVIALIIRFGRRILWIGGRAAARVFAIHLGRIGLVQLAQVLQWMVVLPIVPLETWLLFLTVQLLVNQLPFLPNRDLVFLAIGVELTGSMGVNEAALAAMFVATALLKQATNYAAFGLTLLVRDGRPGSAVDHISPSGD